MNVVYTHDIFVAQRYGGISRYFSELIQRIPTSGVDVRVIAGVYVNEYLRGLKGIWGLKVPQVRHSGFIRKVASEFLQGCYLRFWGNGSIVHQTYYAPLSPGGNRKSVLTVYDMIHERFPGCYQTGDSTSSLKRKCCERADRIIAISHSTKKDLVELFGLPDEKITVIHLASSLKDVEPRAVSGIREPYLFYVGERRGYKNFPALAQVFAQSATLKRHFCLLCFGGGPFSNEEKKEWGRLGISDHVHQISGNDSILAACYRRATAFICPSLYEGFGLTILEAMGLSCPVICSDTGSIPEVAGDAGVYFDPTEEASMKDALESTLLDDRKLNQLKAAGLEREQTFSWERCASETLALYDSLSGKRVHL
jgi:glycosyltransferase involved in cell wall biosynthesis